MNPEESLIAELKERAEKAAAHSYSPYSRFRVGAAVFAKSGVIYSGCNVENASFGLTQCAERSALTAAISAGERPGSLECMVLSFCDGDAVRSWSASDYLPDPFTPESLLR